MYDEDEFLSDESMNILLFGWRAWVVGDRWAGDGGFKLIH